MRRGCRSTETRRPGDDPADIVELTGRRAMLQAITVDEMRRVAATWLTPAPMLARALPAAR